jgi:diguanylate cyclase (GGDEF)-like protein
VATQDALFAIPLVTSVWATRRGLAAARRQPERRVAWTAFAGACGIAAVASLIAISALVGAPQGGRIGLYIGLAASACVLLGTLILAHDALRAKGPAAMVDQMLLAGVGASLLIYLLVVPGFARGDVLLTAVLTIDVVALVLAAAAAGGTAPTAVKGLLLGVVVTICLGDGAAAGSAAGLHFLPDAATPLLWGLASSCFAWAAGRDLELRPGGEEAEPTRRAAYVQTLLPLGAIVGYPVIVGAVVLATDGSRLAPVIFFGPLFLVSTAVAFARQAVMLVEQRRAAIRERSLTADALRRNRELEALTGLASTLTEVLDERPVMERGLEALQVAARTSSSALHLAGEDGLTLVASTGSWMTEHALAPLPAEVPDVATFELGGGGNVARLPLLARGRILGMLTLVRPVSEGCYEVERTLLGLLTDQLGVALQNARDYHEKLEAAIRDPLTGLYNRRYFYEAVGQEIARHERYGTGAALVLFDIDDLRDINDTLGNQCGDEVLEQVGRIVGQLTRPSDTFARIGGEEFGLLMPETGQLDALLVAERLRTAVSRHRVLGDRQVTLSGGVAAMPQDGTTREELQRRADQAMYWAKRNGKNMCAVASEAIASDTEAVQVGMLAHLHGVVAGIDATQLHTRDHSENVASYAVAISQRMGLADECIVRVRRAAFLHDIGKVAVSNTILGKPSALTDEEFEAIKVHPQVGETMLHHAGLHEEARWVGAHHERLDGNGYPQGLMADEIPLEARIIFVADSFEAMTSDRPYRRGMPVCEAVAELRRCAGTQFDREVVETLVGLVERDELAVLALRDLA